MLSRFGISARIFAGFGAILILLCAVVVVSYLGVKVISDTSAEYQIASAQTNEIGDYVSDFNELKLAVFEYRAYPSTEAADRVIFWLDDVATNDAEGLARFADRPEALEIIARTETEARAFEEAFIFLAELEARRMLLVESVVNAEVQFRDRLAEVLEITRSEILADVAISVGIATQQAMLLQQATTKYTQSADPLDYDAVLVRGDEALESFKELREGYVPAALKTPLLIANELVKSYLTIVKQIHENDRQQASVEQDQIQVHSENLNFAYAELAELVRDRQESLRPKVEAATTTTNFLVVGMGFAALLIGLICAFLIGRWLSRAIGQMSADMRRLADGELDIELAGSDQKNELGLMATALEVFRENGRAVMTSEAEKAKEAEADSIKQAAREALQADVAEVVAAAAAGDFTARAAVNYDFEEMNETATSLNNLMATVDEGISEAGDVLAALADTDLTKRVTGTYQGTFAKLKDDTNAVADKLSDVVVQLRGTSRGVKTATGEILAGANDLSERTTKQAAMIEETSAAMEQLATMLRDSTEKAQEVSIDSGNVSKTAEEGAEVMQSANDAMERITASSAKISNIIGMIDDIAFQTNLLALNASVEAARAGEAGKGFAVVAIEVRRLAQSAADASSEVKQLIEQSTSEVGEGSKLVSSAVDKLEVMRESVRKSHTMINAIADESRQQAASVEEVNAAVKQMDEMTQHNAALVEQTNAAIEKTEAQASDLDGIVDLFKVRDDASYKTPSQHTEEEGARQKPAVGPEAAYLHDGNAAIDKDWDEF